MWEPKIPENEIENVLSIYLMMLRQIESTCGNNILDKHLIDGAYKVLNRCGVTNAEPTYQ